MLNIKLKTKQKNCSNNIPIKNCDKPKKTTNEYMQITKDSKKKGSCKKYTPKITHVKTTPPKLHM